MKLRMFGTVGRATGPAGTGRHGGRPYYSTRPKFLFRLDWPLHRQPAGLTPVPIAHLPYPASRNPIPSYSVQSIRNLHSAIEKPATRYQKTENRSQKTDIPTSNRPIQCAMPYALCPMPIIAYHSFSASHLLFFLAYSAHRNHKQH